MGPTIVCLCGSTRFRDAFTQAQLDETLAGRIVLTIGCSLRDDLELFGDVSDAEMRLIKAKLDVLHFHKIALADEILVLNVGGYYGESTEREIEFAKSLNKKIRWLEGDIVMKTEDQVSEICEDLKTVLEAINHPDNMAELPNIIHHLKTASGEWWAAGETLRRLMVIHRRLNADRPDPISHACIGGWICEKHPDLPWPHYDRIVEVEGPGSIMRAPLECAGPGMPCTYPDCEKSMLSKFPKSQ